MGKQKKYVSEGLLQDSFLSWIPQVHELYRQIAGKSFAADIEELDSGLRIDIVPVCPGTVICNQARLFKSDLFFHHFQGSIEIGNLVNQLRVKRLLSGEYPAVSNGFQFRTRDAGPALLDMGVPLLVAHMIVFWYSQDANVTPPVSLASFAGAGVAGANPMRTAFTSWKLAKGLYIIPIVMAYRPLLGVGKTYHLMSWQVGVTALATLLGLIAFAAGIERYLIRKATWLETFLFWIASAGLFWPTYLTDGAGLVALIAAVLLQKAYTPKST